jgi:peptidoglycan/xylan/chitin deacetylase (PgdA/CDA1 family)
MKNPYLRFFLVLFTAFLLYACASRPRPPEETVKETPVIFKPFPKGPPSPEELPPVIKQPFEQALERVKQNGKDIDKNFILDEDGRIVVKAGLRDENADFEIIYDLENAREIGISAYEVDFSCRDKESGALLKDTLVWNPLTSDAGLLLSFDDDHTASWERYFDLFDKYKARVTFFINGTPAPPANSFCARAVSRGHDVGYHSLNHLDLRKMSRNEFNLETIESVKSFRDSGFRLSSFAYPYGFYEPWMHDALLRYFGTLRGYGTTYRLYSEAEIRHGYISSRAIDNTVIPLDVDFYRAVNLMLKTAKFLNKKLVLPLTTHDISASAAWGISPRRLEYLLKTANDLGLVFYCYSDFTK